MNSRDLIEKINYFARKEKAIGLTQDEIKQRDTLRKQYLRGFRANLKTQLDNIEIEGEKSDESK